MVKSMLLGMCALLLMIVAAGCGGHRVEKELRKAMASGETTPERFAEIVKGIVDSNDKAYLLEDGTINMDALQQTADEVGSSLRPPVKWNLMQYAQNTKRTLSIYFERSGSMVPYDAASGGGQLKDAVNKLINFFPDGQNAETTTINIVNDGIYPYQGTIDSFLTDKNIYQTTQGMGDAKYTDFQKILTSIIEKQAPGNISVLVSDLIYSPRGSNSVSAERLEVEVRSLATATFKRFKGKSVLVHKFSGDYDGMYYPLNGKTFKYRGKRPFYIMVIADETTMNAIASDPQYRSLIAPEGAVNSFRFNQPIADVPMAVLLDWDEQAGHFRPDHKDPSLLTKCENDRETGKMRFAVAVDLSGLNKSADFLDHASNYSISSQNKFEMTVKPITRDMITPNMRDYMEGKTHLLVLTGKMNSPQDDIVIALRNDFPQWIIDSSTRDDSNPAAPGFARTTLALEPFMRGLYDAFNNNSNEDAGYYTTLHLHLKK